MRAPVTLRELADTFGWITFSLDEWPHHMAGVDHVDGTPEDQNWLLRLHTLNASRGSFLLQARDCRSGAVETVDVPLQPTFAATDAMASAVSVAAEGWDKPVALRDVVRSLPIPLRLVGGDQ